MPHTLRIPQLFYSPQWTSMRIPVYLVIIHVENHGTRQPCHLATLNPCIQRDDEDKRYFLPECPALVSTREPFIEHISSFIANFDQKLTEFLSVSRIQKEILFY